MRIKLIIILLCKIMKRVLKSNQAFNQLIDEELVKQYNNNLLFSSLWRHKRNVLLMNFKY